MSVTNFRREWKKIYAEAPIQYRDSIRLYYAKEYLSSGYYTVSETAEKCGFDDVSYFVRLFKKKTGLTPGEFKKALLES
jgi:AraC-like DNA-binding protein